MYIYIYFIFYGEEGGVNVSNAVKREPVTPPNWTELMEGAFMASLDCQQSPEASGP